LVLFHFTLYFVFCKELLFFVFKDKNVFFLQDYYFGFFLLPGAILFAFNFYFNIFIITRKTQKKKIRRGNEEHFLYLSEKLKIKKNTFCYNIK